MELIAVIPTAGTGRLEDTLRSLLACDRPPSFTRIVVVENGPSEKAREIVDRLFAGFPVEYVHVRRANKSNALNHYIETLAKNTLLFLTDDDITFDRKILMRYAEAAREESGRVVFGGSLNVHCEHVPPPDIADLLPSSFVGFPKPGQQVDPQIHSFLGANWAVFSDDIKALDGFDPRFGPGSALNATGQENQMMKRMREAGFEFRFVPDAVVWHHVCDTQYAIGVLRRRKFRHGVEEGLRLRTQSNGRAFWTLARHLWRAALLPLASPLAKMFVTRRTWYRLVLADAGSRGFWRGFLSKQGA